MVIWPWNRFRRYEGILAAAEESLAESVKREWRLEAKVALAELANRTAERETERALAELHLVQQDHRHIVATVTGRLTQRTAPLELDRDPFKEIETLPTEYVDEVAPEDLLDSGETEATIDVPS